MIETRLSLCLQVLWKPLMRWVGRVAAFLVLLLSLPQFAAAQPAMGIEAPAEGAVVVPPFAISGWAVDLRATSSTGIDAVAIDNKNSYVG